MFIKVIQPGNDFLQYLGRGNQKHGVAHVPGKGCFVSGFLCFGIIGNRNQLSGVGIKVRQAAVFHFFYGRKYPAGNHLVNIPGVVVFETAPAHGLPRRCFGKNPGQCFPGKGFQFFRFQLFFIQRTDKHQIGQLFNNCQGIGNSPRPDVRPDFIDFISDYSRNHEFMFSHP